jgi:uncharacterized Ntn-hydrolase superfamily protein
MTFSIVAWDPRAPEWGVAVASKFLAVGAAVPWARAGVGAVATQALANLSYGPDGLEMLASGGDAAEVVRALTDADAQRAHRQLGIVDARGGAATYTGDDCLDWAGGRTGDGFACQGNILVGPEVVDDMVDAFESAAGDLPERLFQSLAAGDSAGGDRRGRQSAALFVVLADGGYGGATDVAVDLRVDDHEQPVSELRRLLDLQRLYFPRDHQLEFLEIDEVLAGELRVLLDALGFPPGQNSPGYDDDLRAALLAFVGVENLEERWSADHKIEKAVLERLRAAKG